MANDSKKNPTKKASSSNKNTNAKATQTTKSKTKRMTKAEKEKIQAELEADDRRRRRIRSIIISGIAILIFCLFIIRGDMFWTTIHSFIWGLFGICGIFIPIVIIYIAYQSGKTALPYRMKLRFFIAISIAVLFTTAVYLFSHGNVEKNVFFAMGDAYTEGMNYRGGGLLSSLLGAPMMAFLGATGSRIIIAVLLFIDIMIASGATIIGFVDFFKKPVEKVSSKVSSKVSEKKQEISKQRAVRQEYQQAQKQEKHSFYIYGRRADESKKNHIDIPLGNDSGKPNMLPDDFISEQYIPKRSNNFNANDYDTPPITSQKRKKRKKSNPNIENQNNSEPIIYEPTQKEVYNTTSEPTTDENYESGSFEELDGILSENDNKTIADALKQIEKKKGKKRTDEEAISFDIQNDSSEYLSNDSVYLKPPITLLKPTPFTNEGDIATELNQNGSMLIETLASFGVKASIVNICRGPAVTRYELQPAAGVKISKITNLADDIAMNLAAVGVRIEAPIPGKAAVGVEVANKVVSVVKMRELIESPEFNNAKSKLTVVLGRDIEGNITIADLAKMPHLLIAGSTGSGKSVCINSMLISLIYKSTPDEVKLLMIDPKVVELGVYNGIPHLLVPVVTDPRKAAGALNWAVNHMLERYKLFAENNVRDIRGYNALVERTNAEIDKEETQINDDENSDEFEMPQTPEERQIMDAAISETENSGKAPKKEKLKKLEQIVIIIDELADLMMAAPNDVENAICRLAQMARAAGMHLVIATQRPSVDVITGIIKANIPSRIAFAVKSQIDSRTILDSGGADKLLGRGDMLFAPIGASKPKRVQGCFVDDEEVEKVVEFIKNNRACEYDESIAQEIENNAIIENNNTKPISNEDSDQDPMLEEAIKCVVEAGQASTSLLQRRLRLGYARAGRLIDEMETMGIVGPHEGSKPRQVLLTQQQYMERQMNKPDEN
ncbi:DNA translocase FtsK [Candidatus Pseudoruminococcus sp.]|uniref:DNA translocase FtsK n=1 Tax=Candidatus Pseudoruminococcus sp. TaxID=3101048 RepID=UPI00399BA80E